MQLSEVRSEGCKGKYRPNRLEYLDQLVVEFQSTSSVDAKEQILANLANFAYDPSNYEYFRRLKILDLFLDNLSSQEENFIKFSIGGLCNLCLDPLNKSYINKNGLRRIIKLLEDSNHDVLLSAITTLIYLITPESKPEITSPLVIKKLLELSKEKNSRLENLIAIFFEDYCDEEQVKNALSKPNTDEAPASTAKEC